jgi:hypothetical protein
MAVLSSPVWLWVLRVSAFWLLIVGTIMLTVPTPEQAAKRSLFSSPVGRLAYIYVPSGVAWTIPIDRSTFDDYYQAVWDDDGGTIAEVLSRPGWIAVADRQPVRIVEIDGAAVQVELLGGQSAGVRAWLKVHHLNP